MAQKYSTGYVVVDSDPNTISNLQQTAHQIKLAIHEDGSKMWRFVPLNSPSTRWVLLNINGDADTLDSLDSLDFVRTTDNISQTITGLKTFTSQIITNGSVITSNDTSVNNTFHKEVDISSGGWARNAFIMSNLQSSDEYFRAGLFGSGGDYSFAYLGFGNYTSSNNMRVSPNGNFGFGKTATEKVDVNGNIKADNFIGNGSQLTNVDATTLDSLDSTQFIRSDVNDEATGKLNIGTGITPYYNLNVKDAIGIQSLSGLSELIFRNTTGAIINNVSNTSLKFKTSNTDRLTILNSGEIGINTIAPTSLLTLIDGDIKLGTNTPNNSTSIGIRMTEYANTSFTGFYTAYNGSTNQYTIWSHSTNNSLISDDVKRFSINRDNGNITIGDLGISNHKLNVGGDVNADFYRSNTDLTTENVTLNTTNTSTGDIKCTVSNNRVIITGTFTSNSNTSNIVIGTLPNLAKPTITRYGTMYDSGTSTTSVLKLIINTNGEINVSGVAKSGESFIIDTEFTKDLSLI